MEIDSSKLSSGDPTLQQVVSNFSGYVYIDYYYELEDYSLEPSEI